MSAAADSCMQRFTAHRAVGPQGANNIFDTYMQQADIFGPQQRCSEIAVQFLFQPSSPHMYYSIWVCACMDVITGPAAAGTAQARAARKKQHACVAANAAAEWLRRMMTKPGRRLGATHAPGSNTTTGPGGSLRTLLPFSAIQCHSVYVRHLCRVE